MSFLCTIFHECAVYPSSYDNCVIVIVFAVWRWTFASDQPQPIRARSTTALQNARIWLVARDVMNFSRLTHNNEIFRNDFVCIHYHIYKISARIFQCETFASCEFSITLYSRCCSRPQAATDNGVWNRRSNSLSVTPPFTGQYRLSAACTV